MIGDEVRLSCRSPHPWVLCSWKSPEVPHGTAKQPRVIPQQKRLSRVHCALRLGQYDKTLQLCNSSFDNRTLDTRLATFWIELKFKTSIFETLYTDNRFTSSPFKHHIMWKWAVPIKVWDRSQRRKIGFWEWSQSPQYAVKRLIPQNTGT